MKKCGTFNGYALASLLKSIDVDFFVHKRFLFSLAELCEFQLDVFNVLRLMLSLIAITLWIFNQMA